MPVNTSRKDYDNIHPKWQRLRDVFDGRDAVLKAGEKYVPSLPAKDTTENKAYRERGSFYNALLRTIQGMVGAIFQVAPEVEFPTSIKDYLDDITLAGVPFEMFAQETGREVMLMGRYGVLTDMPADPIIYSGVVIRPYCLGYRAEDIISWRTQRRAGVDVLTSVILHERVEETDVKDPFVVSTVEQYREVKLIGDVCVVQLWRAKSEGAREFVTFGAPIFPQRRGIALNFIPFQFICAMNATPELEMPPFLDLADVNLGHWRNSCDFEYGLHLVALPTPWCSGARNAEPGAPMKIGPSVVWELDVNGSAGMLEFGGQGLESIVKAMEKKEKHMAILGARMLEDVPSVNETASAVRMRHSGEHASLRTVAQSVELGLTRVLQTVAWWIGTETLPVDTEVSVELNKDYNSIKVSATEVTAALQALQAGKISFATWWNFLMTGGWGREGVQADDELDEIDKDDLEEEPEPQPGPLPQPQPIPGQPQPPKPKPGAVA